MMGSGGFGGDKPHTQPMAEINTTPMVDVMLVLLVIFIITTPLLTHTVKINLPQTNSQAQPEKPQVVSLAMDAAGKLYWNDKVINQAELTEKLKEIAKQEPQPELHLRADKDTRYQILAEVMTDAQSVGLTKMGFISEPK
jgi:biopolymer transport protein ExbD